MSKVVRSVKNVTKGYSSVQVKVRNGAHIEMPRLPTRLTELQLPLTIHGAQRVPTWLKSQL